MCLAIRVIMCISMTCRLCLLLRPPKPCIVVKSDFVCVLRCWALRHPVAFASLLIKMCSLDALEPRTRSVWFPKAGMYNEHCRSSTICDCSLGQKLTSLNFQEMRMCRLDGLEPRTLSLWFPKAGTYSEHRMSSMICEGNLGQQLTSRIFLEMPMCRLDALEPRTRSVWVS